MFTSFIKFVTFKILAQLNRQLLNHNLPVLSWRGQLSIILSTVSLSSSSSHASPIPSTSASSWLGLKMFTQLSHLSPGKKTLHNKSNKIKSKRCKKEKIHFLFIFYNYSLSYAIQYCAAFLRIPLRLFRYQITISFNNIKSEVNLNCKILSFSLVIYKIELITCSRYICLHCN